MSLDGVSRGIYEAWMGHKRYLDEAYHRYSLEQLANIYKDNMDAVSIYGGAGVSEFKQKLDAIEKEVKEKDEELRKVNEMLDKLGIPNDRPLEQRLLEYFRIIQAKQTQSTHQPMKTEPRPLPKPTQTMLIVKKEPSQFDIGMGLTRKPSQDVITCPKDNQAYPVGVCRRCPEEHSCKTYREYKKFWT